jgi:lipopolysaccharide biosynthesis glycosyltransferase
MMLPASATDNSPGYTRFAASSTSSVLCNAQNGDLHCLHENLENEVGVKFF